MARSRLYRSQILRVNTRWRALAEIYTMHSFAPFSNLNCLVKNAELFANFAKMLLDVANFLRTVWPKFYGIPPKLSVVSKIVEIKCDLINEIH